jgi:hypothetical protein
VDGSGHRLIVWRPCHGAKELDAIAAWLAENVANITYSVAELANPAREHGEVVCAIAIETGDWSDLETIESLLMNVDEWELSATQTRLHLATR